MANPLETAIAEICRLAHKHEVQTWLDAPGTDSEKLDQILAVARDALAMVREGASA